MKKIIDTVTTYNGNEHSYLRNCQVRIIAICKNAARDDYDPEVEEPYITNDEELAQYGGVTANDRVIVIPWLEKYGRYSFVTSDPKSTDLACFQMLHKHHG